MGLVVLPRRSKQHFPWVECFTLQWLVFLQSSRKRSLSSKHSKVLLLSYSERMASLQSLVVGDSSYWTREYCVVVNIAMDGWYTHCKDTLQVRYAFPTMDWEEEWVWRRTNSLDEAKISRSSSLGLHVIAFESSKVSANNIEACENEEEEELSETKKTHHSTLHGIGFWGVFRRSWVLL